MLFGPVRAAATSRKQLRKALMEFPVRNGQAVRPVVRTINVRDLPVRHNADPACVPAVARAEVDIICACPSDLDGKVHPKALWIGRFLVKPYFHLGKTGFSVTSVDRPFQSILGELLLSLDLVSITR